MCVSKKNVWLAAYIKGKMMSGAGEGIEYPGRLF